ncbi:peroxiredoxin [Bdellovibrio bacteriovorus]|uniref:thioredoxin-dependent peroxiredoxin n=1 Tax=Bdellovibrio bacteriovorus (strain ATCC 15356 / DSM 50701 / NCIMB 9529 / HD100) TaxID=264462 RepID=Q6MM40_BDEBA|nr:peroxiredoxin [Bdellovibrio bacteriovorus]CAE79665.1 bacterioferritin comigratory protein [Bdellovibrio bacteriovorus HD100]
MAAKIELGKKVPNFKIPSSSGETLSLSSLKGKKVVLYFYPKDSTPGCTIEGIEFNDLLAQFKKQNAVVFGVSRDSLKSHDKFICKYDFKFELLSDEDEELCQLFDVIKEKNMYGKKVMGIERSTFVIDEDQKLVGEFRKIKAQGHAAEMLKFIKDL